MSWIKVNYIIISIIIIFLSNNIKADPIDPSDFNKESLDNLINALAADKIDENTYNKKSYNCSHFAIDLQHNLWLNNQIESTRGRLKYTKDGENLNHNEIKVTLKDKNGQDREVHVEAQDDNIYTDTKNLLEELQGGQIDNIKDIGDREVLFPTVNTYVDGKKVYCIDITNAWEQPFTVEIIVKDMYGKVIKDQKVKIKVKHLGDSDEKTFEGVSDKDGKVSIETKTKQSDFGKGIEVEATIKILPKEGEGDDPKDSKIKKKVSIRRCLDHSCVPSELDGIAPNPPIYVATDGEYTQADFTYYNANDFPVEIQPFLEYRDNCDGSPVLETYLDPEFVYIEPYDCVTVRAEIKNLTAPDGDIVVAKLGGLDDEYQWVVIQIGGKVPIPVGGKVTLPVPAITKWGMIILGLLVAGSAIWLIKRRKREG